MSPTRADGLRPGPSATLPRFATAKAACRRACPCVRHPGQALPSSARATSFSTAVALSSVSLMCLCAASILTRTPDGRTLKADDKSLHSSPPTECKDLSPAFSRRPCRAGSCTQNQLASHVACRLRESSCSRLLSGDTVAQAAARAAAGPYQLGWVPCGSRLGRTRPAGPALCVLNVHERITQGTSL